MLLQPVSESPTQYPVMAPRGSLNAPGLPLPGYLALPLYDDVHAAAGHGAINSEEPAENLMIFREDWIRHDLRASRRIYF